MRLYITEVYDGDIHVFRGEEIPFCVGTRSLDRSSVLLPYNGPVWNELKGYVMSDLDQMWLPETLDDEYSKFVRQTDIRVRVNFQLRCARAYLQLTLSDQSVRELSYPLELSAAEYAEFVSAFFGQPLEETGLSTKYFDLLKSWAIADSII